MARVKKENRILTVEETEVQSFLNRGYDEVDEKGKVIRRATGGRMVSLAKYNQALEEIEKLKKELAKKSKAK